MKNIVTSILLLAFFISSSCTKENHIVESEKDKPSIDTVKDTTVVPYVVAKDDTTYGYGPIFEYLTSPKLGGRYSGSEGSRKAAKYIAAFFGPKASIIDVSNNKARMQNIILRIKGQTDSTIVIGAHYDSFGFTRKAYFPGADDNASGTSVVMMLAKKIISSSITPKYTIDFCLWDGEENGRFGSKGYLKKVNDNYIKFYINIDTCGNPTEYPTVIAIDPNNPFLNYLFSSVSKELKMKIIPYSPKGFTTDCEQFIKNGVPYLSIGCSYFVSYLHTQDDTIKQISYKRLNLITETLSSFLISNYFVSE